MPSLTGRPADPEASPTPSADPRSPAGAQAKPWTPEQRQRMCCIQVDNTLKNRTLTISPDDKQ